MSRRVVSITDEFCEYLLTWKLAQKGQLAKCAVKQTDATPIVHAVHIEETSRGSAHPPLMSMVTIFLGGSEISALITALGSMRP